MDVILRTRCGCSRVYPCAFLDRRDPPDRLTVPVLVGENSALRFFVPEVVPQLVVQTREFRLDKYTRFSGVPEYYEYIYPSQPVQAPLKFRGQVLSRDQAQTLLDAVGEHEDRCDHLTEVIDRLAQKE